MSLSPAGTSRPLRWCERWLTTRTTGYRSHAEGENSQVYPALKAARSDLFGLCVCSTAGATCAAGDAEIDFAIMSVSKPFVFGLVCQSVGAERARACLGVNGTGLPFNSLEAVERSSDGRTNPMVNSGAIAATSLVPGATTEDKWGTIHRGLSGFAGHELTLNADVYDSALRTNQQNRSIAALLDRRGRIYCDPAQAIDLYTRQCSLDVSSPT
jgi:glutaminase